MKDVLLIHNSAWPHTSVCTHEAIAKMGCTVPPHPAYNLDQETSDYHLFGRVKGILYGCYFADDSELKQSFCDVLWSWGRGFTTVMYIFLLSVGISVLKTTETLWKNSLIIAKDVWIVYIHFFAAAITFYKKKWRHYFHIASDTNFNGELCIQKQ
jgi:hypothetical protein